REMLGTLDLDPDPAPPGGTACAVAPMMGRKTIVRQRPMFTLCYASRRSTFVRNTAKKWMERASNWGAVQLVIAADSDDMLTLQMARKVKGAQVYEQCDL